MRSNLRGLFVFSLVLACAACDDGGGGDNDAGVAVAQDALFGRVTAGGQGVAGATVIVGGVTATTGADGSYEVAVGAGAAVARVEAEGHVINVQRVQVSGATALDFALLAEAPAQPLDATMGGAVDGERGARVTVPAGGLVDPAGAVVEGEVAVHLTPIDPAVPDQLAAAPGDFEARQADGSATQLETFGMLDVTIRQGESTLQVAPGERLEIRIPAPMGQAELPPEMPLWSFDEAQGLWIEEGTLALDAESGTYVGAIEHMSVWNADKPLDTTCVSGTVVDADSGAPLVGARVSGTGVDYLGTDATTTDAQGRFALLVKVGSEVSVAAYHQSGGGEIRTITSGDAIAPQPVSPGDDSCTDGGTWTVRRGEVTIDGAPPVSCDVDVFNQLDLRTCVPLLVELGECHQPSGACTQEGLFDIEYANGAATRTNIGDDGSVSIEYFGPGGVPCGQQEVQASAGGVNTFTLVLPDGRRASYGVDIDVNSGSITYQCANGGSRTLTSADQQRLQACTGGGENECAEVDNSIGDACEADADCGGGDVVCCVGICLERASCPLAGCDDDAQCADGQICCPTSDSCLTEAQCVSTGWCETDAQCGEGRACCDGVCDNQPFCEGFCQADGDCEAGICCAQPEGNYCAADAEACFSGQACAQTEDCGDPAVMTCCDGTCQSWSNCYEGGACAEQSECGGEQSSQVCCEREGAMSCEDRVNCASFRACGEGEPACTEGTLCCNNPAFFDGEICLPPELCFVNQVCEGDADCGGLDCCAIPQDEARCVQECPEEWRQP